VTDTRDIPLDVIIMRIVVSLFALILGGLILTAPNFIFDEALNAGTQKIAAGWIGAVIGYWLS